MLALAALLPVTVWPALAFVLRKVGGPVLLRFILVVAAGVAVSGFLFASIYPLHQAGPFIVIPFAASSLVAAVIAQYILQR